MFDKTSIISEIKNKFKLVDLIKLSYKLQTII